MIPKHTDSKNTLAVHLNRERKIYIPATEGGLTKKSSRAPVVSCHPLSVVGTTAVTRAVASASEALEEALVSSRFYPKLNKLNTIPVGQKNSGIHLPLGHERKTQGRRAKLKANCCSKIIYVHDCRQRPFKRCKELPINVAFVH